MTNHMRLQHPHIIDLREARGRGRSEDSPHRAAVATTQAGSGCMQVFRHESYLVLVMEYAAGGDLYRYEYDDV